MYNKLRILIPSWPEAGLNVAVALMVLLLGNAGQLWKDLLRSTNTDVKTTDFVASGLRGAFNHSLGFISGRTVTELVWAATALIALLLVLGALVYLKDTIADGHELRRTILLQDRPEELTALARLALRTAGVIGVLLWPVVVLSKPLPRLLDAFLRHVAHLTEGWLPIVVTLGCVLAVAALFWLWAICWRLTLLRIRVFGQVVD